jgi:uncharacterized protein YhfF
MSTLARVLVDGMRVAEFGHARTLLRRALVEAVMRGDKIATAGLVEEEEKLAEPGERFVVLDYEDEPVGVIEMTDVRVVRAADVDERFARDEGEGFESVADWREAHERFWSHREITDDTPIVCERFRLVQRGYP